MICQKCNKKVSYGEKCYCQRCNEEMIKNLEKEIQKNEKYENQINQLENEKNQ